MSEHQDKPSLNGLRVGFIGLGNMGGPMAVNLVKAGAEVRGFDVVEEALQLAREHGVQTAPTADQAVHDVDVVLTMLPSGQHVLDAYRGTDGNPGLLQSAAQGSIFLDCSTIDIVEAREAAELATQAGFEAADAPVSGGVVGAEAGTLAFMVGGQEQVFAQILPMLQVMGSKIVHCGPSGAGQAAKICNNMLLGITMIGACEAFVLGEGLGLSDQALFDVISQASGQCWSVTTNCPVPGPVPTSPANRDYKPGFAAALMKKDLGLAAQALDHAGVEGKFGRAAGKMYSEFVEEGGAKLDFSAIIKTMRPQVSAAYVVPPEQAKEADE